MRHHGGGVRFGVEEVLSTKPGRLSELVSSDGSCPCICWIQVCRNVLPLVRSGPSKDLLDSVCYIDVESFCPVRKVAQHHRSE